MNEEDGTFTGGCQCGAVRYKIDGPIIDASVCHCRMCQKATGGVFGAYVAVSNDYLAWTRGKPTLFASSSVAQRGFCPSCGTPLTYQWSPERTALTIGSFDEPDYLTFDVALATENMHPALHGITEVETAPLANTPEAAAAYASMEVYQHPDHDTENWQTTGKAK